MAMEIVLPQCDLLDARRREMGWTIDVLAQESGFAPNTILRCLHGKNVRLETFVIVASTLGLRIDVRLKSQAA
jgi:hypothetical protein